MSALVELRSRRALEKRQALPQGLQEELAALKARTFEPPQLVKDEFEKMATFEVRKAKAQAAFDRVEYQKLLPPLPASLRR